MKQKSGLVVGITGQSGGGKTFVGSLLSEYGFHVINADIVSRKVVEKGSPALAKLVKHFGNEILQLNGELDRSKLGSIVFNDMEKKKLLEDTVFPYIIREITNQVNTLHDYGSPGVFLDAPTLFESGLNEFCDKVVVVIAPRELRSRRILERDSITPEQVEARLSAQHEDEFYTSRADYVLENKGKPHDLEVQLLKVLDNLGLYKYIEQI